MLIFSILCVLLFGSAYSQKDVICGNYQAFTKPHERLVENKKYSLGDSNIKEQWYGIKYFTIPYQPPGIAHCGTFFPIYLKEEPSTSGNIQNITACAQGANGCEFEINVQVQYCSSSLTVYKLSKVSSIYAAYCLRSSGNGDYPDFKTRLYIKHTLEDKGLLKQEYEMTCYFRNPGNTTLEYKAEWFVNGRSVYESNFADYEDENNERVLTDTRLSRAGITSVGFTFYCEVTARFRSNQLSGLPSRSSSKFLGIEVEDQIVNVKEGDDVTVYIKPTMPLGCNSRLNGNCNLTVIVITPDTSGCVSPTEISGDCGIQINSKSDYYWHPINVSTGVTLERGVQTTRQKLYLRTITNYPFHPIWENYQLPTITVVISKDTRAIEGRKCTMTNDPYLRDFKNRYLLFDLGGVFILYQSDIAEIQVQVTRCNVYSFGYCICGAIIRVGGTVFMMNSCNSDHWFIDYIRCDDGGYIFDIKTILENEFQIFLPSGTKITINLFLNSDYNYNWMGISIDPSVRDYDKTSGLCNNLNDENVLVNASFSWSRRLELPTDEEYFNQWKLSPSDNRNLFVGANLAAVQSLQSSETYRYCTCNNKTGISKELSCKPTPPTVECAIGDSYKIFHQKRCNSPSRKKRSIPTFKNMHLQNRHKRDVSWKNGWTEEKAVEYCGGLFNNSRVIEHCSGIKGLNVGNAVQSCMSDIQLSGTDAFALSSISTVGLECISEARMNRTLREVKLKDKKSILETVKEVTCPGECSGHGRCDKGKCICNSEYSGSGCSVPLNKPPVAHSLEADGICDLSHEDCTEVAVFGGPFVDNDQTKCKLFPFEIKNGQMTVSNVPYITTAIFDSFGEVTCNLPPKQLVDVPVIDETVTGYKISVSNNGQNYSQQLDFIIYNTECINCTTDNCSFSPTYCIMDGGCYSHKSTYNTGDREYMCRADSNGKTWIPVPEQCRSAKQQYLPFADVNKRLVSNEQYGLSDRFFKEGWYGTKDYIIPNSAPGLFHCGTIFPIYLKESPASSGNIENITACIQGDTVCDFQIQIQALVCPSSLTVYNLVRPSLYSASYCLVKV